MKKKNKLILASITAFSTLAVSTTLANTSCSFFRDKDNNEDEVDPEIPNEILINVIDINGEISHDDFTIEQDNNIVNLTASITDLNGPVVTSANDDDEWVWSISPQITSDALTFWHEGNQASLQLKQNTPINAESYTITVENNGIKKSINAEVEAFDFTTISLKTDYDVLDQKNNKATISATVGGTTKAPVNWTINHSKLPDALSFTSYGKVAYLELTKNKAIDFSTFIITAECDGEVSSVEIIITKFVETQVSVSSDIPAINQTNNKATISATVTGTYNSTNSNVEWTISPTLPVGLTFTRAGDKAYLELKKDINISGGTYKITATCNEVSNYTEVDVVTNVVTTVSVSTNHSTLDQNITKATITATSAGTVNQPITWSISPTGTLQSALNFWYEGNFAYFELTPGMIVYGFTYTITATCNGVSSSTTIRITPFEPTTVRVQPNRTTLGQSYNVAEIKAEVKGDDSGDPIWSISPALPSALSFETSGKTAWLKLTPDVNISLETYTIRASYNDVYDECAILVYDHEITTIDLQPDHKVIDQNNPITTINATVSGTGTDYLPVVWSISPSISPSDNLIFKTTAKQATLALSKDKTVIGGNYTITATCNGVSQDIVIYVTPNEATKITLDSNLGSNPTLNQSNNEAIISATVTGTKQSPIDWSVNIALPSYLTFIPGTTEARLILEKNVKTSKGTFIITAKCNGVLETITINVETFNPTVVYIGTTYTTLNQTTNETTISASAGGTIQGEITWSIYPQPSAPVSFIEDGNKAYLKLEKGKLVNAETYNVTASCNGASNCVDINVIANEGVAIPTSFLDIDANNILYGFKGTVSPASLSSYDTLSIPHTVKEIASGAFENYFTKSRTPTIKNVNFDSLGGSQLINIGAYAFNGCTGLERGLSFINPALTIIGVGAFNNCSGFVGDLNLPNSLTTLGSEAFKGCSNLNGRLTLPRNNDFTKISYGAFKDCNKLSGSLEIHANIKTIEDDAFRNCSSFSFIGFNAADNIISLASGSLSGWKSSGTVFVPSGANTSTWKSKVQLAGLSSNWNVQAFAEIPRALLDIDSSTKQLKGFVAGANINGYNTLSIPSDVTSIASSAFIKTKWPEDHLVRNLVLPADSNLTSIGSNAFSNCSFFWGSLIIPNKVVTIGAYAFRGCEGFDSNLVIGSSVTTINEYAFANCKRFTELEFLSAATNPWDLFGNVPTNKAFSGWRAAGGTVWIPKGQNTTYWGTALNIDAGLYTSWTTNNVKNRG